MKTVSFKVSDDEALQIRNQAKRERLSLSEYLRRRALPESGAVVIGKVRCEYTGAEIFAPLAGAAPFTTAEVRDLLADFP